MRSTLQVCVTCEQSNGFSLPSSNRRRAPFSLFPFPFSLLFFPKPKKLHYKRRGITLIELLVVLSVLGTLMFATLAVFRRIVLQWNGQVSRSRAILAANSGIDEIAGEMSDAVTFNLVDGLLTNTFTLPANTDAAGNYIPTWNLGTLSYAAGDRTQYYLAAADGVSAGNILWRRYNGNGPTGGKPKKGGKAKKGGAQTYAGWTNDIAASLQPGSATRGIVENVTSLNFLYYPLTNTIFISLTVTAAENQKTTAFTVTRTVYLGNHN